MIPWMNAAVKSSKGLNKANCGFSKMLDRLDHGFILIPESEPEEYFFGLQGSKEYSFGLERDTYMLKSLS
jgi:hypothetical protein